MAERVGSERERGGAGREAKERPKPSEKKKMMKAFKI